MKVQPVHLEILFLLRERAQTGLNVNAIYRELVARKFSRNKKLVLTAIDDLEKGDLLDTIKGSKAKRRVKQKKTKILTQLGDELVRVTDDLNDYADSCSKLQNVIKQYFSVGDYNDKKVLRNVLLNRGWKPEDINNFDNLFRSSKDLSIDLISPFQVINIVLIRYILVLSKIKYNKNAKIILDYIIMDNINRQLSNTAVTNIDRPHISLAKEKINFITDFLETAYFDGNRFTNNEVDDVLLSVLKVLDVPCDVLKSTIDKSSYPVVYDYKTGNPSYPPGGYFMEEFWFDCKYLIQHKINEKYGLRFDIYNLRLEAAHILESKIPPQVKRGSPVDVFVKINGDTKHAFLNLLIVDPDIRQMWYPDPSTWDSSTDTGTLNLTHQQYSSRWTFTIPSEHKLGEYKALIILYEVEALDKDVAEKLKVEIKDIAKMNKHILDFQEIAFDVIG